MAGLGALSTLAGGGCGADDSELTTEEMLEKLAGRHLSAVEVAEQLELADLLCGFDNQVLVAVWDELNPRQLEFQDFVFGHHCPERLSLYQEARPTTGTAPASPTTTTTGTTTTAAEPARPEPTNPTGPGQPR